MNIILIILIKLFYDCIIIYIKINILLRFNKILLKLMEVTYNKNNNLDTNNPFRL